MADLPGGLAGPGRARDSDPELADPSALVAVLDEQYHWVPARALQVGWLVTEATGAGCGGQIHVAACGLGHPLRS